MSATKARVRADALTTDSGAGSYDVGIRCLLNNSRKPEEGAQEQKTQELSILICVAISATTF